MHCFYGNIDEFVLKWLIYTNTSFIFCKTNNIKKKGINLHIQALLPACVDLSLHFHHGNLVFSKNLPTITLIHIHEARIY